MNVILFYRDEILILEFKATKTVSVFVAKMGFENVEDFGDDEIDMVL